MTPDTHALPMPVAADSVHVWRGFRAPSKSYSDFAQFLGAVFVPACALLQPNAGLRAYIPSMPAQAGKPPTVPDQTALMFWASQEAYTDAFKTPAVRAYTNLHGGAYGPGSSAQFPVPLDAHITPEQPYHLLDAPADWMLGTVRHLVGARKEEQPVSEFLSAVEKWALGFRSDSPPGIDAALLCAGNDYVVFWEHWPVGQQASVSPIQGLEQLVTPFLSKEAQALAPGGGLWDQWPGFDLVKDDCINVQLSRPAPGSAEAGAVEVAQ